VLEFVNSKNLQPLGALGTSCPDHFLRTKIRPLIVDFDPAKPDVDAIISGLDKALEDYRADYARYYNDCKHGLRISGPAGTGSLRHRILAA
jgi:rhamnose utilization protein RhaD (predicted bifunctional aldolase and dehydrogenase)